MWLSRAKIDPLSLKWVVDNGKGKLTMRGFIVHHVTASNALHPSQVVIIVAYAATNNALTCVIYDSCRLLVGPHRSFTLVCHSVHYVPCPRWVSQANKPLHLR